MITQLEQRRAWLESRRLGIGGSDIAGILGRSPWASPWSIWADKVGLSPLDEEIDRPELDLGRDLEPVIAKWFNIRTGLYVAGEQMMVHDRHGDPFFATVDGLVLEPGTDDLDLAAGIFEAKYSADAPWDTVPEHYQLQVQWAMYCAGLERAWIAAMHLPFGRPRFTVYEIERDDDALADIVAAVRGFWDDHVLTGIPPEPDAHRATTSAINAAWLEPVAQVVDLDEIRGVVEQLANLRDTRRVLDSEIDIAENLIKVLMADRTEALCAGVATITWRAQQNKPGIDIARVRADHGAAYDKPAPAPFRVFRFNDKRSA